MREVSKQERPHLPSISIRRAGARSRSGQATVEYIALIAVVAGVAILILNIVNDGVLADSVQKGLVTPYQKIYKVGSAEAKDPEIDSGDSVEGHPRMTVPQSDNFKIFIYDGN